MAGTNIQLKLLAGCLVIFVLQTKAQRFPGMPRFPGFGGFAPFPRFGPPLPLLGTFMPPMSSPPQRVISDVSPFPGSTNISPFSSIPEVSPFPTSSEVSSPPLVSTFPSTSSIFPPPLGEIGAPATFDSTTGTTLLGTGETPAILNGDTGGISLTPSPIMNTVNLPFESQPGVMETPPQFLPGTVQGNQIGGMNAVPPSFLAGTTPVGQGGIIGQNNQILPEAFPGVGMMPTNNLLGGQSPFLPGRVSSDLGIPFPVGTGNALMPGNNFVSGANNGMSSDAGVPDGVDPGSAAESTFSNRFDVGSNSGNIPSVNIRNSSSNSFFNPQTSSFDGSSILSRVFGSNPISNNDFTNSPNLQETVAPQTSSAERPVTQNTSSTFSEGLSDGFVPNMDQFKPNTELNRPQGQPPQSVQGNQLQRRNMNAATRNQGILNSQSGQAQMIGNNAQLAQMQVSNEISQSSQQLESNNLFGQITGNTNVDLGQTPRQNSQFSRTNPLSIQANGVGATVANIQTAEFSQVQGQQRNSIIKRSDTEPNTLNQQPENPGSPMSGGPLMKESPPEVLASISKPRFTQNTVTFTKGFSGTNNTPLTEMSGFSGTNNARDSSVNGMSKFPGMSEPLSEMSGFSGTSKPLDKGVNVKSGFSVTNIPLNSKNFQTPGSLPSQTSTELKNIQNTELSSIQPRTAGQGNMQTNPGFGFPQIPAISGFPAISESDAAIMIEADRTGGSNSKVPLARSSNSQTFVSIQNSQSNNAPGSNNSVNFRNMQTVSSAQFTSGFQNNVGIKNQVGVVPNTNMLSPVIRENAGFSVEQTAKDANVDKPIISSNGGAQNQGRNFVDSSFTERSTTVERSNGVRPISSFTRTEFQRNEYTIDTTGNSGARPIDERRRESIPQNPLQPLTGGSALNNQNQGSNIRASGTAGPANFPDNSNSMQTGSPSQTIPSGIASNSFMMNNSTGSTVPIKPIGFPNSMFTQKGSTNPLSGQFVTQNMVSSSDIRSAQSNVNQRDILENNSVVQQTGFQNSMFMQPSMNSNSGTNQMQGANNMQPNFQMMTNIGVGQQGNGVQRSQIMGSNGGSNLQMIASNVPIQSNMQLMNTNRAPSMGMTESVVGQNTQPLGSNSQPNVMSSVQTVGSNTRGNLQPMGSQFEPNRQTMGSNDQDSMVSKFPGSTGVPGLQSVPDTLSTSRVGFLTRGEFSEQKDGQNMMLKNSNKMETFVKNVMSNSSKDSLPLKSIDIAANSGQIKSETNIPRSQQSSIVKGGIEGKTLGCQKSGCPSGEQCVDTNNYLCTAWIASIHCRCLPGCKLVDMFIPRGQSVTLDNCNNQCTCAADNGVATCTQFNCPTASPVSS